MICVPRQSEWAQHFFWRLNSALSKESVPESVESAPGLTDLDRRQRLDRCSELGTEADGSAVRLRQTILDTAEGEHLKKEAMQVGRGPS